MHACFLGSVDSKAIHPIDSIDSIHPINPIRRAALTTRRRAPAPQSSQQILTGPSILILLPIGQHIANAWTVGQPIDLLEIGLAQFERFGRHIGDVLAHQLPRIDAILVDLLHQEAAERFHARAQEGGVEGDIDPLERDGGETPLEGDRVRFLSRHGGAFADDVDELGFDRGEVEGFHQVLDVDLLSFEEVGHIGEAVEGAELNNSVSI